MDNKAITTIVAIIALTELETVALLMHIDGAYLLPIAIGIAGLGGFKLHEYIKR